MREADEGLARALRGVLADHGRRVSEHPERVRALLSDALGARSREWRADIDALVMAAEERVPATVTDAVTDTGLDGDDEALVRALTHRGLTVELARGAIDLWRSVLTDGAASTTRPRTPVAWERPAAAAPPVTEAPPTAAPPPSTPPPAPAPVAVPATNPALPTSRPGMARPATAEAAAPTEIPLNGDATAGVGIGVLPGATTGARTGPALGAAHDRTPGSPPPTTPPPTTAPPTTAPPTTAPPTTAPPTAPLPPASSAPKVVTMSRGRAAGLGAAALVAAVVAGGVGARQLDPPPRAALVAATPTTTPSTVTSTSVETVTVTAPPKVVRSTVVIDATKLRAVNLSGNTMTYVTFPGSAGCVLKPKRGTAYRACSTWDYVEATGSVKSWKITSARVIAGTGTASGEGKRLNYYYNRNGPYTAKVRYTIEGGGYFSTGVYTFQVQCNPSFVCKQSLPL